MITAPFRKLCAVMIQVYLADSQQRRGFRGIVERLRELAKAPNMPFLGTNCST